MESKQTKNVAEVAKEISWEQLLSGMRAACELYVDHEEIMKTISEDVDIQAELTNEGITMDSKNEVMVNVINTARVILAKHVVEEKFKGSTKAMAEDFARMETAKQLKDELDKLG